MKVDSIFFRAPYEPNPQDDESAVARHHRPVAPEHGGYAVHVGGEFVIGPFFVYENAQQAFNDGRSFVVRWVDFVHETPASPEFRKKLLKLKEPLTVRASFLNRGHVEWPHVRSS